MESDWKLIALGELVQNHDSRRVPLSGRERERRRGKYPYYGATGVMDYVDDFLFEGLHLLVAEDGSVERPDGKPFLQLVEGQFWVNNHAHVLRAATDEDTRFLYYALSTVAIRPYMSGSVQAKLSQANLNRILTPYPPNESDRRAIAHILGTLDDKIELNRRMSETLEAMARALFRSWFVDFDPVRWKMERQGAKAPSRTATQTSLASSRPGDFALPPALADLFPDSFQDSDLGPIPAGWEVGTLADVSILNPETWTKDTRPAQIDYIDLSNTKRGRIEAVTPYLAKDAPSRAQRVLRPGDTIVGTVRPGNCSYAFIYDHGLTGSTGFAVLRPQAARFAEFTYLAATAADNIDTLAHLADGAAYPAVRAEVVAETPIVRPDDEVMGRFSRVVGAFLLKVAQNERQARTLAALRDALLPKLISGELRVPDADRILESPGHEA